MSKSTFIYQKRAKKAPNILLVESLHNTKKRGLCLDLGSGGLYDARYLLAEGFEKVISIDASTEYLKRALKMSGENFEFQNIAIENFKFPKDAFDIVSAQFILPFLSSAHFTKVWKQIYASLKKDGIFSGQLFGVNDGWNTADTHMLFFTEKEVKKLLKGYEVLKCQEIEQDGKEAIGNKKHWHFFNLILKKK